MNRRVRSRNHLDFIRQLPCLPCGNAIETQAAHIRALYYPIAKPITGMGIKSDDCYTVPLCGKCHDKQHRGDEFMFWDNHHIGLNGAILVALALFAHSGDIEKGEAIVGRWRR